VICPNCGFDNLPGTEECAECQQDLTHLDRPVAHNRIERSLMEDPVSLLGPARPVTLPRTATVQQAIRTMIANNVGTVLVVSEEGQLLGIFSERDLLLRVAGLYSDHQDLPIERFMTLKPETVKMDDTLAYALHRMDSGGYRHLPVLHEELPVGMISVRDMLRHFTKLSQE
jgi:CBS domain-containing protein